MYYTYIIKSIEHKSFYVGITNNPEKRLREHNSGKVESTRTKKPWILWHIRKSKNSKEARKEEIYLKKKDKEFKEKLKNI